MTDRHEHRRDGEEAHYHEREENGAMPSWLRWAAAFINRVGFPIFAFCVLSYFYFVGLKQNTKAIEDLRDVMISVKATLDAR